MMTNTKVLTAIIAAAEHLSEDEREDLRAYGTESETYGRFIAHEDPFWANALVQYVRAA